MEGREGGSERKSSNFRLESWKTLKSPVPTGIGFPTITESDTWNRGDRRRRR